MEPHRFALPHCIWEKSLSKGSGAGEPELNTGGGDAYCRCPWDGLQQQAMRTDIAQIKCGMEGGVLPVICIWGRRELWGSLGRTASVAGERWAARAGAGEGEGRGRSRAPLKLGRHCVLVDALRLASVSKRTEGERGPGDRRRREEDNGHAHELEDAERRRGSSTNNALATP